MPYRVYQCPKRWWLLREHQVSQKSKYRLYVGETEIQAAGNVQKDLPDQNKPKWIKDESSISPDELRWDRALVPSLKLRAHNLLANDSLSVVDQRLLYRN